MVATKYPAAAAVPLNHDEFMALFEALSMYVENCQADSSTEDPYEENKHLGPAEAMVRRMATQLTMFAEMH